MINLIPLVLPGFFGQNTTSSSVYSAGIAVLVLHIALGVFIYRVYYEDQSKMITKKD